MSKQLCICGASKAYPLCDESHEGLKWSCGAMNQKVIEIVISTSVELYNLAQRLAYKLDALVVTEHYNLPVERLIRLCSLSLPYPTPHIQANQTLNIAIDVPQSLIIKQSPEPTHSLTNLEPKYLYKQALQAIQNEDNWVIHPSNLKALNLRRKIFLSHAVVDQLKLSELIHLMRIRYELNVFVCSDSLILGGEWYSAIIESLSEADLVVQIITENSNKSTFCAFEAGYSIAAEIPLLLICFDQGVSPPAHLQHIQASELWKSQLTKPWMTKEELALSVILEMLVKFSNHVEQI